MADSTKVDGLDVRVGMILNHPTAGPVKVIGASRKQKLGGAVVNVVELETVAEGTRGYLELREGQTFTRAG